MNARAMQLLTRFEVHADEVTEEIAAATVAEVEEFGVVRDARLLTGRDPRRLNDLLELIAATRLVTEPASYGSQPGAARLSS